MKLYAVRFLVLACYVAATGPAFAQADSSDDSQQDAESPREIEVITVTGTRLTKMDESARVEIIDSMEIAARGLTTAEDVIRSVSQNLATVTSATSFDNNSTGSTEPLYTQNLGVSTANLRGMGSANTLVLVNGRRVAGVSGQETMVANIRHIPAASIDRVEVYLDGASSIYGADAVAGVINIILKKNFTGGNVAATYENSSTDAEQLRLSGNFGYSWGSGNVSMTLSKAEADAVNSRKAGFVTRDYSDVLGPTGDLRTVSQPRAGLVSTTGQFGLYNQILPAGHNGVDAQPGDFIASTSDDLGDDIPVDMGPATEDTSATFNIEQVLADRFTLRGEVLWTEAKSDSRSRDLTIPQILVPESNAFNNFGQEVWVRYYPTNEIEAGMLPGPYKLAKTVNWRYVAGVDWAITDRISATVDYIKSTSEGDFRYAGFNTDTAFRMDMETNQRLADLIASSDPGVAPNFFGDGSAQNDSISEFYVPQNSIADETVTESFEAFVRGELFSMPAGSLGFVIGGEKRDESIANREGGEGLNASNIEDRFGVAAPTRDLTAVYGELSIPLFSSQNARPGFQLLTLNVSARYDDYKMQGSYGRSPPPENEPSLIDVSFSSTSPRLGLSWRPVDSLLVRGSYGESFRPPVFSQMFRSFVFDQPNWPLRDPLDGQVYFGRFLLASNPDVKPETSESINVGFDYTPAWSDGLTIRVDYSEMDYTDRIVESSALSRLLPADIYGSIPELFIRDENGVLVEQHIKAINIAESVNKAVDVLVSKAFNSNAGEWLAEVSYYRVLDRYDTATPDSEPVDFVGTSQGVDRYKLRGRLNWLRDNMQADLWINYTPGHTNNEFEFNRFIDIPTYEVSSYTTVDLSGSYDFRNGLIVRAGGRNIFDEEFPFSVNASGFPFDSKRVDLRGRILFLEASYNFDF